EMYVVLKEPLKEGFYNASIKAKELKEDLLKYDLIDGDQDPDVVGGLLVH
ncbi:MAG: hypothetical protein JNN23_06280, partial [Chryseobacterium gambrini]|nr:hypothetical protein [Chryseobacterium gambrini]